MVWRQPKLGGSTKRCEAQAFFFRSCLSLGCSVLRSMYEVMCTVLLRGQALRPLFSRELAGRWADKNRGKAPSTGVRWAGWPPGGRKWSICMGCATHQACREGRCASPIRIRVSSTVFIHFNPEE